MRNYIYKIKLIRLDKYLPFSNTWKCSLHNGLNPARPVTSTVAWMSGLACFPGSHGRPHPLQPPQADRPDYLSRLSPHFPSFSCSEYSVLTAQVMGTEDRALGNPTFKLNPRACAMKVKWNKKRGLLHSWYVPLPLTLHLTPEDRNYIYLVHLRPLILA